jgi:hypothetical protein
MRNRGSRGTGDKGQGTAIREIPVGYSLFPIPYSLQFKAGGAR